MAISREIKRRPRALSAVAVWVLFVHFIDLYWLIMPAAHPEGPAFHWTVVPAFFGVGGVAVAFTVFRLRGSRTVPVGDPYLEHSLRYTQP